MPVDNQFPDPTPAQYREKIGHFTHERKECVTKAQRILARATVENRELTQDEANEAEALTNSAEMLTKKIDRFRDHLSGDTPPVENRTNHQPGDHPGNRSERGYQPGEYRSLGKGESLREHLVGTGEIVVERRSRPLSLGKTIRGIVSGDWTNATEEKRALGNSSDIQGGYLIGGELSAEWIDRARSRSVMMAAGARVVPMRTASMAMARITSDPVPGWRSDGALIASSDPLFGSVNFSAKSLAVSVPVARELLADAQNAAEVIESVLESALALELDRAILDGDGVQKPQGIRQAVNVGGLAVGGAANTLHFAQAVGAVLQENETPTGIVCHPRTFSAAVDRAVDSTGQPLRLPPSLERLPWFQTTSVPANIGGSNTVGYVGDFSKVILGLRSNIEIRVATEARDASGRGFERNEVIVVGILRADSMLIREKAFCVLTGITN